MSKVDILKYKLLELVNEINKKEKDIKLMFNQQDVKVENMSVSGANGRLYVFPISTDYDVSLSGESLELSAYAAMQELFGKEHDGFKQPNSNTGIFTQPYWRTDNFELVKKAVYIYSKTTK